MQQIVLPALMKDARNDLPAAFAWGVRYLFTGDFRVVHPAAAWTLMSSPEFEGTAIAAPLVREIVVESGAQVLCGDITAIVPLLKRTFEADFVGVQVLQREACTQNYATSQKNETSQGLSPSQLGRH